LGIPKDYHYHKRLVVLGFDFERTLGLVLLLMP